MCGHWWQYLLSNWFLYWIGGFIAVKWLIQCGAVVLLIAVSRLRLLLDSVSLAVEVLGNLCLLEVSSWDLLFLHWEAQMLLDFLLDVIDVVGCTPLQWLQHLLLRVRQLVVILDAISLLFGGSCKNGPVKGIAFALMAFKREK